MANNDNIIYAKFNHGREITTDSRSQYAYGQVLKISGLHLPASFDADISNKGDKQAKVVIGTDNELPIDDAFFLSGKDVIVMINVHAADKDGRTKYIIRIPVEKRPERADIELEPVEQDVISTAIATLNEAVEQTSASAESAKNSANRAHESAVNAETSATNASNSEVLAQQYMERAETAAENAEQSETKAKTSEDNAKASETHAEQIATEIEQYTGRAETASTNAESSASIATQKATEASAFANIATTKANEASTSATNAQNSADNAQQSATSAQESANSASASASRALVNAEKTQSDKEIVELAKSNVLSAVGEAQTYATTAQSASQAIQDMSVEAVTLEVDSDVTVEKSVDPVTGAVTLTYGIPKGVKGEKGDTGSKGDKGDPFVYSDFTPEQLASLKGEKGDKGDQGIQGIQGERGIQGKQGIQGVKGDTGEKGDKGDAFTYSDFTPEQLASLKGAKGDKGDTGNTGAKGDTGDSGVYVGTSAPSDTNVNVWIDSDGEPDFGLGVPPTAQTVAEMDETESSIWIYTGSEPGYIVGNWYYYNGSAWVSGGVYGAGVVDSVPTQGSTNAVSSGGVYSALADNNVRLEGLESVVGQTKTVTPTWTDGRSINPNTGGTNASEISSNVQGISCEGFDRLRITMPLYATAINTRGLAFYSAFPSTDPIGTANFISGIRSNYNTALSADSSEVREVSIPSGAKYFRTTWYASSEEQFSTEFVCELIKDGTLDVTIDNINSELDVVSDNVFNKTTLVLGKFIGLNGNIGTSESYAYTDYIAVKTGDIVKGYSAENIELTFRYVCAYNKDKAPISASGAENTKSYTVPDGIAYVRITGSVRSDHAGINSATARITLNGVDSKYQPYKTGSVSNFAQSLYSATQLLTGYPLTTLNPYILKSLAYKPLGVLSKGYVCLVSDDGDAELATYMIPMLESKGDVPCTFAVMHQSAVFQSQSGIDAVVNAVTNHNCNIAQHGVQLWNTFDEYTFNAFLDSELAYFQSLGLTPYGAVCPQHAITDIVKAVAGGRLGCVRTGYNNADMYYGTYQNGPRSNIYALSSQSSLDGQLADQIVALDACKANKWLRVIHWHEDELTSEKKAVLEGIIDYVLADNELTFVTMKDIPGII